MQTPFKNKICNLEINCFEITNCDKSFLFYASMILVTCFRLWLSNVTGFWFNTPNPHDDELLIRYTDFFNYFSGNAVNTTMCMNKELGWPVFLNFISKLGIPLPFAVSALWIIAAIIISKLVLNITKNRALEFISYCFVLFTPAAFELWCGTRLYRNILIAPTAFIVFALALSIWYELLHNRNHLLKICILSALLSCFFSLAYYIKEDGIWLLAILLFFVFLWFVTIFINFFHEKGHIRVSKVIIISLILLLPLLVLKTVTITLKLKNAKSFGVYETNNRTQGELGRFARYIYEIQSDERSYEVWAPLDAIEKAFENSESLKENPMLYYYITHSPWLNGDIKNNPIRGDFLTWVLRDAILDAGQWKSAAFVEGYFHKVNGELREAFESGRLKRDRKFQLVKSLGGMSVREIVKALAWTRFQYKDHIFLDNYEVGAIINERQDRKNSEFMSFIGHYNITIPENSRTFELRKQECEKANNIISKLFFIYKFIQPLFMVISFVIWIIMLMQNAKSLIKRKQVNMETVWLLFVMGLMLGISVMYSFSISAFLLYLGKFDKAILFYSVGMIPCLEIFELFGVILFIKTLQINEFKCFMKVKEIVCLIFKMVFFCVIMFTVLICGYKFTRLYGEAIKYKRIIDKSVFALPQNQYSALLPDLPERKIINTAWNKGFVIDSSFGMINNDTITINSSDKVAAINGWAVDIDRLTNLKGLYLKIGEKFIECRYGRTRFDVQTAINCNSSDVGFTVCFPFSFLEVENGYVDSISFIMETTDGYLLEPIVFNVKNGF